MCVQADFLTIMFPNYSILDSCYQKIKCLFGNTMEAGEGKYISFHFMPHDDGLFNRSILHLTTNVGAGLTECWQEVRSPHNATVEN